MCQGPAPLALLTHKRTAASVRSAGACVSYLPPFGAHRDRIVLRELILLHMLGLRHFMPVHMLRLVRMLGLVHLLILVHMRRPLCLGKSNHHGDCKQRRSEWLQHPFCAHIGWCDLVAPLLEQTR